MGDAIPPASSPPMAHTPPLGAARQQRSAAGNGQQPGVTAAQASYDQDMADLTRSNELLASRVSQLASKLESSVDLDAMIKENYQLLDYKLRQGAQARVDSNLRRDSDGSRPTTGLLPQSSARAARQGPDKTKGALRYGE